MTKRTYRVFRTCRPVRRRDGTVGYKVEIVTRGTGVVLHTTGTYDSGAEAQERAKGYIAKYDDIVDTTPPRITEGA